MAEKTELEMKEVNLAECLGLDVAQCEGRLLGILETIRNRYKGNFPDYLQAQKLTNKEKNLILMGVYWAVVLKTARME